MRLGSAIVFSIGACLLAAVLEGLCAGKSVTTYFKQLRWPRYAAPLWIWYVIGGVYYLIFFVVIYRLLTVSNNSIFRSAILCLVLIMMLLNALWNYVFFRMRRLFFSFVASSLTPILDITLFLSLLWIDRIAALVLIPYLVYRIYGVWWGYWLWKLNRNTVTAG